MRTFVRFSSSLMIARPSGWRTALQARKSMCGQSMSKFKWEVTKVRKKSLTCWFSHTVSFEATLRQHKSNVYFVHFVQWLLATLQCWWSPWSQHYNGESMKSTSQCGVYEVESIEFTLPCGLNEVYITMWNVGSLKFFLQGSINWNWHDNMECDLEHWSQWSLIGESLKFFSQWWSIN